MAANFSVTLLMVSMYRKRVRFCGHFQSSPYEWAIVSDPVRAFLFVLVRDIEEFTGSQTELEVLALVQELGFTSFWNVPLRTVHEGCTYTESPSADFHGTSGEGPGVEGSRCVKMSLSVEDCDEGRAGEQLNRCSWHEALSLGGLCAGTALYTITCLL